MMTVTGLPMLESKVLLSNNFFDTNLLIKIQAVIKSHPSRPGTFILGILKLSCRTTYFQSNRYAVSFQLHKAKHQGKQQSALSKIKLKPYRD